MRPGAPNRFALPDLGIGVGLRTVHFEDVLARRPSIGWFEAITENFLDTGGRPLRVLEEVAERWPVVLHGVSLSIGGVDPLDGAYLAKVAELAARTRAAWVSDHLCWTGVAGRNVHDLLPLPYDEATLAHVVARVREVQERLGRPLVLENPSTYVEFTGSTMPEHEFLARLAEEADCGILLDVNNVYVSARNHGFDPDAYVDAIPADRVVQYHLAGHTDHGTHVIDTHSTRVVDPVWRLFERALARTGPRATLLEWDEDIPSFDEVVDEAQKARPLLEAARRRTEAVRARAV